ncbi:hypothetical protein [Kistimonas asteriae]|uniref:hypothetical protein n=1 Tax=Kistimonas asteriae TaxID=517724 RepID=UPI001BA9B2E6|nr:hypothetical protein [Kistimonas asteriae]
MEMIQKYPEKNIQLVVSDNSYDCQQAWKALACCFQQAETKSAFLRNVDNIHSIDPRNPGKIAPEGRLAASICDDDDRTDHRWISVPSRDYYHLPTAERKTTRLDQYYEPKSQTDFFNDILRNDACFLKLKAFMANNFHFHPADWSKENAMRPIKELFGKNFSYVVNASNIAACLDETLEHEKSTNNQSAIKAAHDSTIQFNRNINDLRPILTLKVERRDLTFSGSDTTIVFNGPLIFSKPLTTIRIQDRL